VQLAGGGSRILASGLLLSAALAAATGGGFADLRHGLERGLIFAAFIPTLGWLRAAAERSPAIDRSRDLFERMGGRARDAGLQVGAHLLGAVITAGVIGLFAPLVGRDGAAKERAHAAQATVRGMCLAVLWSPCFVGMAVASRLLPEVPLWRAIILGLGFATLGLVLADLLFGLRSPRRLFGAALAFRPILAPLFVGAGSVVLATAATPLSSLEAVLTVLPPLGALWLVSSGVGNLRPAVAATWTRLGQMADDLLIIVLAMVLASAIGGNQIVAALLESAAALQPPPPAILAATLAAMVIASFAGLHPMVTISVLVPLVHDLPGQPVGADALMMVALFGWSLGTINSPSSLSIILASTNFRVPLRYLLFDRNLVFVLLFGAVAVVLLSLLNAMAGT
jgi:hypothetical protein